MKRILDVYFCCRDLAIDDVVKVSSLHIDRVRVLLQLHCNLIAVCFVHLPPLSPSSLCLFNVLPSPSVPPNGFPPASSWQYIASMARSRWAQTLKLPTQTATCSTFVEMLLNTPAPFPRLMYVCSPNWSAGTAVPPSVCRKYMCTLH